MSSKKTIRSIFHPKPAIGQVDTSLRYTDILFGFVIKEIFTRLQNWPNQVAVKAQLIVALTLVLGSWIGYRRSTNRSFYEVKFFNLPFFRFLVDQFMLIMYFRVAVMTPLDLKDEVQEMLALKTALLMLVVFVSYAIWDALGLWMARARDANGKPIYFKLDAESKEASESPQTPDWNGFLITLFFSMARQKNSWVVLGSGSLPSE